MRILHVTPYASAAWAYGGIPRVVGALTRSLAARGHQVTVCATDALESATRLEAGSSRSPEGVEQHVFPNWSNHLAYQHQLFLPKGLDGFLRRHSGGFDVAHLHACRNLPGVAAARHLRRAGVPYVLAPNGTAPAIERKVVVKQAFDWIAGRRVIDGATRIIAVTRAEEKQLLTLGVPAASIALIPNPVDVAEFSQPVPSGRLRDRLGLISEPLVMFLGKQTRRKRVDVLVEAFAALARTDAHLVIAGNDMGAGADVRRLVSSLGLERRTHFTGLLRGSERLEALADADIVVYPSEHEVFGLVPLEALLCGTPVIVAHDSGSGEVIRSIGGGLVTTLGSVTDLAHAIDRMLGRLAHWRSRAVVASVHVRRTFSQDVVTPQLEHLYEELAVRVRPATRARCRSRPETPKAAPDAVSVVIPVHNGGPWLRETVMRILEQVGSRTLEIIIVDDRSQDDSATIARELERQHRVRVIDGLGRGAAAAINTGLRVARHSIVCQIDQDVFIGPDWLSHVLVELEDPTVAAAQGYYEADPDASLIARVMALDLEHRYESCSDREVTHVCTGNTAFRSEALKRVGLFDESMGYGYDNDMSYRLRDAGYRLAFSRAARSRHRWRDSLGGYLAQQYGFGFGRLDLVAKHPSRLTGDSVSPTRMMAHPLLLLSALAAIGAAPWLPAAEEVRALSTLAGTATIGVLVIERLMAGLAATRRTRDLAGLLFVPVHLLRDLAWIAAMTVWLGRRALGYRTRPADSMTARRTAPAAFEQQTATERIN